ncbi:MAG: PAS domain S-box protein [Deltaproteobacteria bacterium]|nr:PAS domain S-box protein [Deltaproteobacteria bacterium]
MSSTFTDEQYFRSLIENLNDIVTVLEIDGTIRYISPSIERILGYTHDELRQKKVFDYIQPEDLEKVNRAFDIALKRERELIELECRLLDSKAEWHVFRAIAHVTEDQKGDLIGIVTLTDITDYKNVEAALKAERDRAQQYLDLAGNMFVALDKEGKVTLVNKAATRILGYEEKDILGRNWFETFLPARELKDVRGVFSELMGGKTKVFQYYENPVITREGEERMIAWQNTLIRDNDGSIVGTLSSGFDVTERNRLEDQLRQSQKMEAVGLLAGGIAHDFNNLLTTILGNAQLAMMDANKDTPLYEELEEIRTAGEKAADLTRRLLAFSRKEVGRPRFLVVNDLVREMEKLLRRMIEEDIELEAILAPDLWSIYADPNQIDQVIMNLVVNSREAMPKGGRLTIRTANVELDAVSLESFGAENSPGSYVMISIRDTGMGMDRETQSRIFEPFFSTKERDMGSGLGLSTVYGIVKQNGGFIHVKSEPETGTTMEIYFPRAGIEDQTENQEKASNGPQPRRFETILVVEDDDLMRGLAVKGLRKYGYRALGAKNFDEAVRISGTVEGIDMLLTDVVLEGMNGKDLAERLRTSRPGLKLLFMSGYPQSTLSRHDIRGSEAEFIKKPFTPEMLARKVREVMDKS